MSFSLGRLAFGSASDGEAEIARMTRAPRQDCFGSFRDAIYFATGGHIDNAPLNGQAAAHSSSFREKLAAGHWRRPTHRVRAQAANHANSIVGCCTILSVEYEPTVRGQAL